MSEIQDRLSEQRQPSAAPEGDPALRADLESLLVATNEAQVRAERATSESEAARAAAEDAAAAAVGAQARAEEAALQVAAASRELSEAGDRLARGTQPARVNGLYRNTKSPREPLPGFDDASTPRAHLDLEGHYRLLNPSFAELVGFSEREFRSASWPSLIDRDNRDAHRALHAEMREGRRDSAQVQTFYTGGAGLLVEVSGTVSLVRDAAGEPAHLIFELDQP
jgi:PAS domain S-box-containing protein